VVALAVALAGCASQGDTQQAAAPAGPAPAPAETRNTNLLKYAPAFEGQTRAPNIQANAPVEVKEYARGLTQPFGIARLPNGKILVTERPGALRVIGTDGSVSAPLEGVPKVAFNNQGGLLDVELDPKFASNGMIYCSYSEPQADGTNNTAVFKAKYMDGATPRIENVQVIYHQSPSLNSPLHFGSRIVFAKDGTMFVTQGERSILPGRVQAQDLKSLLGKVVRINTDGSVPKDNPFVGRSDARPEIWTYGNRNVQGAFIHPKTGELWGMEHAPQGGDEINVLRKGRDYGWPTITYGVEYGPANTKIGEGAVKAGMEQPVYYWDPVIAPGSMLYYTGSAIPKWTNSIFVPGLNANYVARLTMNAAGDKVIGEERLVFSEKRERYRDMEQAADGSLYLLTDGPAGNARLLHITPRTDGQVVGVKAWVAPPPPAPRVPQVPAPTPN
jgi:glucose/arabinose dehydrogenase